MQKQYVVVHFKGKKGSQIFETTKASEVIIGGVKVWRPKNPEPPFREIKVLKIEHEGKSATLLPLDEIEEWALMTTETQSGGK